MNKRKCFQRGAATLVGVLIAMVVAGVGLYALMQTQGEMTSGISNSKARAQAKELAQLKIQELHGYIEKNQFTSDLPLTPLVELNWDANPGDNPDFIHKDPNQVVNVNEIYEEWQIRRANCSAASWGSWCSDLTEKNPNGNYLEVMVRESWADESGDPQSVSLNNFIVFKDPATISGIWEDETGESSDRWERTRMNVGIEKVEGGTEGDTRTNEPADESNLLPGNNVFERTNSRGNKEIYILGGLNGTTPVVVLTAFGGIIHQIRGKIHFEETKIGVDDLDEMVVIATSPAYCEYPVYSEDCPKIDLAGDCVEYICFVPGDCSNEIDVDGDFELKDGINNSCQFGLNSAGVVEMLTKDTTPTIENHLTDIKNLGLNGGWYGKVGLFGAPTTPFDDIIAGDSCDDPARFYVSNRLCHTTGSELCPDTSLITGHNTICEYQRGCTFQQDADKTIFNYTGYISHCDPLPADYEIIDGYCIKDPNEDPTVKDVATPYAIYENEGINGSYAYNHFWLIDGDLNDKSCSENLDRFSQSGIPGDPVVIEDPQYLVDHNLVRPLGFINVDPFADITPWPSDDNGEPANVITTPNPNNMGLENRIPPPAP